MEQSIHLGRVRGIEVGANWSLALIAALMTWVLATDVLPTAVPDRPEAAYWATGAVTAALFFGSLLVHELSHALVARQRGVEVKQITLWLFGGVAKMENESTDPAAELRIGGVGPLVSIAIGVLAIGVALLGSFVPRLELAVAALAWLGFMNVVLGVFNLLPAFPLDGGRVLRAALWQRSGDHVGATVRAGRVGVAFGYGLSGLGLLLVLGGLTFNGLWFLFLGWFLVAAARAEVAGVTQHELLAGVRVAQVMSPHPITAPAAVSVAELVDQYVLRYRHSAYPVVAPNGDPVGLVTLDRVRAVPPDQRAAIPVGRVSYALNEIPLAHPADEVGPLLATLAVAPVGRALVLDHGELVGIVALSDIVKTLDLRELLRSGAPTAPAAALPT